MASFPTYGMAGIGIATAIGFVFALSILVNTGGIDVGQNGRDLTATEQQKKVEMPEESGGEESAPLASDNQEGPSAPAGETTMMQVGVSPTLNSIVALDDARKVIGEVVPGTEFTVGESVLFQANFSNPGDVVATDHFIAMSIRNAAQGDALNQEGQPEQGANFRGDIAANGSVELELNWTPRSAGDYRFLVFSATPEDLFSTQPIAAVASIPISVGN